jgi:hypothetical protein
MILALLDVISKENKMKKNLFQKNMLHLFIPRGNDTNLFFSFFLYTSLSMDQEQQQNHLSSLINQ